MQPKLRASGRPLRAHCAADRSSLYEDLTPRGSGRLPAFYNRNCTAGKSIEPSLELCRTRCMDAYLSSRVWRSRNWLIAGATCCLLLACAGKPPPPAAQNRCPPNRPGCQIEVVFTDVGLGERVAFSNVRLS